MIRAVVALAAALALLGACGARAGSPTNTLDRYSAALKAGNYKAAYRMMSERFRAKHSQQEFMRMMKENVTEVRETASQLRTKRKYEVSAEFRYGLGDRMRLVREKGRWRIATVPVFFYSQASPRDALRSFIRAYRLERWDVMLRIIPNKIREQMDEQLLRKQFSGEHREEIASMMNMLEANIDEPISNKGTEARMPYHDQYEVIFVREDGLWKIKDFD